MTAKAIPHRHCIICGKVVDTEETFCSDSCKMQYSANKKRQRMMMFVFVGLMVLILLLSMAGSGPR